MAFAIAKIISPTEPAKAKLTKSPLPVVTWAGKKIPCTLEDGHLKLNLEGLGITNLGRIGGLEMLTDLWSLNLDHNEIMEIEGLNAIPNLRHLHLRHNHISRVSGLDTLVNLTELYLRGNEIKNVKDILPGIKNLTKLEKLGLENNSTELTAQVTKLTGVDTMLLKPLEILALNRYTPDFCPKPANPITLITQEVPPVVITKCWVCGEMVRFDQNA